MKDFKQQWRIIRHSWNMRWQLSRMRAISKKSVSPHSVLMYMNERYGLASVSYDNSKTFLKSVGEYVEASDSIKRTYATR